MEENEEIGYRKGALEALVNEKMELSRLLNIVNSLIENHAKALNEKGIDVEEFINGIVEQQKQRAKQAQEQMQESPEGNSRQGGQKDRRQGGGKGQPSRESGHRDFSPGNKRGKKEDLSEDLLEPGEDEWA
ncbi:MAG: hypothetical protein SVV03_02980 [Candidatus Nanohaloarchaea archaeon]|nr:hypothetical protein [Candidatus Nanohaloarchaea archaeon]